MQALILAGGLGTRLRSIVNDAPKPMAQMSSKPFLEHQVEFLKRHHISEFVFCVGYLHQYIQDYFGDGRRWNIRIDYSIEEELVGTGGALKQAEPFVKGPFLALNGDSFFDIDLTTLVQFHERQKLQDRHDRYLGTLALTPVADARDYGLVKLDPNQHIVRFSEKVGNGVNGTNGTSGSNGHHGHNDARLINAGIYLLEPEILRFVPPHQKVSIERETFPTVLEQGYRLGGYASDGFFVDIGTPAGYHRFQEHLQEELA
jgi:mannose-1-phosphate guanylyltransferase